MDVLIKNNQNLKKIFHFTRRSKNYPKFLSDYFKFKKLAKKNNRFQLSFSDRYPCLDDKTSSTQFDSHYIYHPAWAARIIAKTRPSYHVDISSALQFSTILSAFLPVYFYDYRPANLHLENLHSQSADLTSLSFKSNSIVSLSCMHTVEHIGLGRYGDHLDPEGDLIAISELKRVLAPSGNLLFVVPVGKPRIMFNAHRIYSFNQISEHFSDFELINFTLIPDDTIQNGIINNATSEDVERQEYGCGCFWFKKN